MFPPQGIFPHVDFDSDEIDRFDLDGELPGRPPRLEEVWMPCPGYRDVFASSAGRISRVNFLKNGQRRMSVDYGCHQSKGYRGVRVCLKDGTRKTVLVHALVALAFFGPRPKDHDVNHKDGVRRNNRPDNLEYTTRSGNIRHGHLRRMRDNHLEELARYERLLTLNRQVPCRETLIDSGASGFTNVCPDKA